MSTLRGEIARSEPGRLDEQLQGRVWLTQERGKWPVALWTNEGHVLSWLGSHPDGVTWEYEITPVRRVQAVRTDPYLEAVIDGG